MDEAEQRVLFYDPDKCSGCLYCMIVCSFHHFGVIDLDRAYLRVHSDPSDVLSFVNAYCAHCEHPSCEAVCPVDPKAVVKDPSTGIVTIEGFRCIGCRSCVYACPISIPHFDDASRVCVKCDLCDGDPLCAKFCSTGALKALSREEARRLIKASAVKGRD